MRNLNTLVLLFFLPSFLIAQRNLSRSLNVTKHFIQNTDIKLAYDSTISLVGTSMPPTMLSINSDIVLSQTDRFFNFKKAILLGDSAYEYGRCHFIDRQGNTLIVGSKSAYSVAMEYQGLVIKLDTQWNLVWAKKIEINPHSTGVRFCKQVKDGNYILGGLTKSSWEDPKGWLCKLDSDGNQIWCKTYKREFSEFNSLDEDSLGQLFVTGYSTMGMSSGFAMKLSSSGDILWDGFVLGWAHLNGKFGPDGHVYVVGEAPANSRRGFLIQKYHGISGQRLWVRKYNTYLGAHIAFDLCFDNNGHLYVIGSGSSSDMGSHLLKLNYGGALISHVSFKNSYVMANYSDNQAIIYDTSTKKIYISAGNPNPSSESFLFLTDTSLAGTNCIQSRNFALDTVSSTGITSPIKTTTVASINANIQPISISKREVFLEPVQICVECDPGRPDFSISQLSSSRFAFNITSDSISGYSYIWNFGDSTTSTLKNPMHSYLTEGKYKVNLIAVSPGGLCKDSISKVITVDKSPVGLESSFKIQGINLFPNPASESFTVRFIEMPGEKSFRIRDNSGKEIAHFRINDQSDFKIFNINLDSGVYFIEVESGQQTFTKKVIIN
ncbi:MAG: T9SS type A sorting domain-containing protein [Bacteroidetes bacterium]|nr:T9SS type A sorting domain-containing protein [Bacteroidota bacterium]